jgi:hypothetical protein
MAGLFGEPLEVRARELRCRSGWGADRWEAVEDDIVIDIQIAAPASDDEPSSASAAPRWRPRATIFHIDDQVVEENSLGW